MYKLIDKKNGYVHQMNEDNVREFLSDTLQIEDSDTLQIEEVTEILHMQGYSLERN